MSRLNWRSITDFAKRKQWPLRLADRLGRGTGRLRLVDRFHDVPAAPKSPDLAGWENADLAAAWVGHATVLLRMGGLTILTNPVFSLRVGLGLGLLTAGPLRLQRPALAIKDLPPIDVILLSHAHFDHLDRPSLARLPKRSHVVTYKGVGDLVRDLKFASVTEMNWGDTHRIAGLAITGMPVQHWGARTFYDTHRGYGAFLLEADNKRVLYGADTAYQTRWQGTAAVDLAILGIGAYNPYIAAHATPEQAMEMADHVKAERVMPIHHSTFKLSHEPMTEPLERMLAASKEQDRIVARQPGDVWRD
ncbi:MAG: MBL fold metallo-hydrolase [Tepidisphaeraceae bacterium]